MPPPRGIKRWCSLTSVWRLMSVAYIWSVGGVCGRPARWRVLADRVRLGRPVSRLPLRASVAGLSGGISWRPPAYSLHTYIHTCAIYMAHCVDSLSCLFRCYCSCWRIKIINTWTGNGNDNCVLRYMRSCSRWRNTRHTANCRGTYASESPTTTSTDSTAKCTTNEAFSENSTIASRR